MKIISVMSLFFLGFLLLPQESLAKIYIGCVDEECSEKKEVFYQGFVPCGKEVCIGNDLDEEGIEQDLSSGMNFKEACEKERDGYSGGEVQVLHCQFCHFFVMIDGIVDFLLIKIVPILSVGMLIVGGLMFYLGGAKPELVTRGKRILTGVVVGLVLIYGAYLIVGTFLTVLGVSTFHSLSEWAREGVFTIKCPITLPSSSYLFIP